MQRLVPSLQAASTLHCNSEHVTFFSPTGYQFYATIGAFYLPVTVMIVIYYRIYVVSSRIAASEAKSKPGVSGDSRPPSEAPSMHALRKPSNEENHNIHCPNHNGHAGRNKSREYLLLISTAISNSYGFWKSLRFCEKTRYSKGSFDREFTRF